MKPSQIAKSLLTGFVVAVTIAQGPASAQVSTTGNGPYYATPSWDQKLTTARFVVLANWNNEAVLDRETGLVWEKSPDAARRHWFDSGSHCRSITTGNRKGWRLPTINELQSLVDPSVNQPSLPLGHPFLGILVTTPPVNNFYWSSTTDATSQTNALLTNFANGSAGISDTKTSSGRDGSIVTVNHAWCVRGQGGGDPQ